EGEEDDEQKTVDECPGQKWVGHRQDEVLRPRPARWSHPVPVQEGELEGAHRRVDGEPQVDDQGRKQIEPRTEPAVLGAETTAPALPHAPRLGRRSAFHCAAVTHGGPPTPVGACGEIPPRSWFRPPGPGSPGSADRPCPGWRSPGRARVSPRR